MTILNDSDFLLLLSTSNITLSNEELDMQIGTTESSKNLNVLGNVNISFGSKYLINGTELSLNDVNGTLSLDKGGTGTSLTSIDDLKEILGTGTYKITDISPAYFNLTTTGIDDDINGEAYMKPMTFTIYGKNFDKNIRIKIVDNLEISHNYINTIYYDSPVKIRAVTKYIKVSEINQVDKYPYKIKIYNKDDITKQAFSGDIYKDEAIPQWSQPYDNVIYDISQEPGFSFNFSVTDSDDPNTITYSYSLADGDFLPEWLNLDIETGILSGDPPNNDLTSYSGSTYQLTIKAISGTIELSHLVNFHILTGPTWSTPSEVELSENTFTLEEAVSYADSILNTTTNITYSIETNSDADNISLYGNTITVTDLELLGDEGKNITLTATDAYGYSSTNTINIKYISISNIIVYGIGRNSEGQLGIGNTTNQSTPYPVTKYITYIACSFIEFSIFIENNRVWSVGSNAYGQLGLGNTTSQSTPQDITYFTTNGINIAKVSVGYGYTIFLADDGKVYSCGYNNYGQLGHGNYTNYNTPQEITFLSDKNITHIECGYYYTLFLTSDGKVYSCGYNVYGQLGLGHNNHPQPTPQEITHFTNNNINITQIACGSSHAIFLASDGKVYGAGYNSNGQLGLGHTTHRNTPDEITYFTNNGINITHASGGYYNTIFIASDGKVYSVGQNSKGQLGLGNYTNYNTPQEITYFTTNSITITQSVSGSEHTVFLASDGKVYGCGNNNYGQLGHGNYNNYNTPQEITYFTTNNININLIASNAGSTIFLDTDSNVYTVGNNASGQLGLGNTTNQIVIQKLVFFNATKYKYVKASFYHSIFIADDGKVYSAGYNIDGQLGLGNYTNQSTLQEITYFTTNNINITLASGGGSFSIFVADDGKVYGVGNNSYGQLGLGNTTRYNTIQEITFLSDKNITQVACGSNHTMFLASDGKVYGCGYNGNGQLGLGNTTNYNTPQEITYFTNINITDILCGSHHIIFIASDGKMYGCGRNDNGNLGVGNTTNQYTPVEITYFNNNGITITQVACGSYHTMFLASDGKIYGVGHNGLGQLGLGDTNKRDTPVEITFLSDKIITYVEGGYFHTMFIASDGKVYSCGYNNYGQLGHGNYTNYNTPQEITFLSDKINTYVTCGLEFTFLY